MAPWSYPEDMVTMVIGENGDNPGSGFQDNERVVDFSMGPPAYAGNMVYIQKLKEDLGIKVFNPFPYKPWFLRVCSIGL